MEVTVITHNHKNSQSWKILDLRQSRGFFCQGQIILLGRGRMTSEGHNKILQHPSLKKIFLWGIAHKRGVEYLIIITWHLPSIPPHLRFFHQGQKHTSLNFSRGKCPPWFNSSGSYTPYTPTGSQLYTPLDLVL